MKKDTEKERAAYIRDAERRIWIFRREYVVMVKKYRCCVTAFGWEGELGMGIRPVFSDEPDYIDRHLQEIAKNSGVDHL